MILKWIAPIEEILTKRKQPKQSPPSSTTENTKSVTNKRFKNNVIKGGIISDSHTLSGRE